MRRRYLSLNHNFEYFDIMLLFFQFLKHWQQPALFRLTARSQRWSWRVKTMRFSEVVCCLHESGFPKIKPRILLVHQSFMFEPVISCYDLIPVLSCYSCIAFFAYLDAIGFWDAYKTNDNFRPRPRHVNNVTRPRRENDWNVKRYLWLGCWITFPMDG